MRSGTIAALAAVLTLALAGTAQAVSFNPTPGAYTFDTTSLTMTGAGPHVPGAVEGGTAVFSFDEVNIPEGVTISVTGSRPFKMVAAGAMNIAGEIDGSGVSATREVAVANPGGPGGGASGKDGSESGEGPGGGQIGSNDENGGGGGGFGGFGATGGVRPSGTGSGGEGGLAYSDITSVLEGGSGGAGGTVGFAAVAGGGGGGAIALFASSLSVSSTGEIYVVGGDGSGGNHGGSGGGSGGALLMHANTISMQGLLDAEGGQGGGGGCCGDGGGGGGGEIAYQYRTLSLGGETFILGGESGAAGPFSHGGLSPEFEGEEGFIVEQQGASATSSPATAVTTSGATMNGSVNPNGTTTSYRFEYGTSTSYGSTLPVVATPVGSGIKAVAVSQALTGLSASTTYHYRLVTTDAAGFTTAGNDVSFTTTAAPAAPSPPPPPVSKPKAPNTKLTKAKVNKETGTATFKFKAVGTSTGFQCSLAKKGKKAKFKKCKSPKSYKGLKAGKYTFQVKAVNGSAADATPAKKKFKIS